MNYTGTQHVEDKREALAERIMFLVAERGKEHGNNINKRD